MGKLSTNVLIAGRSGAGKSTLLNYLFQKEIEATGMGGAVTPKGIFSHTFSYDESFDICICDSWGLEAGKTDEWSKLIINKVQEHDLKAVNEWFNTIIFCVSANWDRVEDFECQFIRNLLKEKNQVIVVITNCKSEDDPKIDIFRKRILKEYDHASIQNYGLKEEDIIGASSVKKDTIGGSKGVLFGRERIFTAIIRNLWRNLQNKVPNVISDKLDVKFKEERDKIYKNIYEQHLTFRRTKKIEEFEKNVNSELEKFIKETGEYINQQFKEAIDYYDRLSRKYSSISLIDITIISQNQELKYDALESFEEEISQKLETIKFINETIKNELFNKAVKEVEIKKLFVSIKVKLTSGEVIRKELDKSLRGCLSRLKKELEKQIKRISDEINKLDIEELFASQLKRLTTK